MVTGESDPHAAGVTPAITDAAEASPSGVPVADVPHSSGHGDDHDEAPLGPVDWGAWLFSAAGVGAGALMALLLFLAIQNG